MGSLSTQWRARAEELNSALAPLMNNPGVVQAEVQAVKAAVLPELLLAMADLLEVLEASPEIDEKTKAARERMERNAQIRMAAATGDYDAIDRIINDTIAKATANTEPGTPAGAATPGGS